MKTDPSSLLVKEWGLHLELPEELSHANGAQNWLNQVSDILAQALVDKSISLTALEIPTNQPSQVLAVKKEATLEKYERATNLWVNVAAGTLEIGTEVILKGKETAVIDGVTRRVPKAKQAKFILNQVMAEQLGNHLLRLAASMEGGR